ncbi:MAG: hypothetical protein GWN39_20615, partial [Thermoplasmata archaeon]|nr:hypothetical protein [Thermoplasmata archaeon]NIV81089.1 hypothetical protein [Thermoplasmata archaeon]
MTRPEGRYSSVEEMVPPVNATGGYPLAKGEAFGPSSPIWSYNASPPTSFFAQFMGGVQRLPNGHTLVCGGSRGYSFEIDEDEKVVWDYSPMTMFRAYRYYPPALVEMELNATEDELLWVNMTSFASDLDTDFDHLVVRENSPFVEVLGLHLLAMYPEGITMDVFDLSVSDGIFEVKRRVLVNVTPVNDPLT